MSKYTPHINYDQHSVSSKSMQIAISSSSSTSSSTNENHNRQITSSNNNTLRQKYLNNNLDNNLNNNKSQYQLPDRKAKKPRIEDQILKSVFFF